MFNFISFLMSLRHSIPFKHAIHFLACITLDLISLSIIISLCIQSVAEITPCPTRNVLQSWRFALWRSILFSCRFERNFQFDPLRSLRYCCFETSFLLHFRYRPHDKLADWPTDWLADWLTDWLNDWMTERSADTSIKSCKVHTSNTRT